MAASGAVFQQAAKRSCAGEQIQSTASKK